jgi:hypothetical protein
MVQARSCSRAATRGVQVSATRGSSTANRAASCRWPIWPGDVEGSRTARSAIAWYSRASSWARCRASARNTAGISPLTIREKSSERSAAANSRPGGMAAKPSGSCCTVTVSRIAERSDRKSSNKSPYRPPVPYMRSTVQC